VPVPSAPAPVEIRASVRIVYLGPVAPHWEVELVEGDRDVVEEFRLRVMARLLLLPFHDPQFRRNRDRVMNDGEREGIIVDWDFGLPPMQ
jgi:hypothetical protein